MICVWCFSTTSYAHSWCGGFVCCYGNADYARKICSDCVTVNTPPGYCAQLPICLDRQLIKIFWQSYKKPCKQLATHTKLNRVLKDFDNGNCFHVYEQ
jgi:hypothetical protein